MNGKGGEGTYDASSSSLATDGSESCGSKSGRGVGGHVAVDD